MQTITIQVNGKSHNVTRTAKGFIVSIKGQTRIFRTYYEALTALYSYKPCRLDGVPQGQP